MYNTLTDSILMADRELKDALESGNLTSLTEDHVEVLSQMGFIVEDDADERKILSFKYHREKYSSPYSTFVIFPTLACNLACPYCYERTAELPPQTMDDETVKNTISFIKQMSSEDNIKTILIKLYGGEPLINAQACLKICEEIALWTQQNNVTLAVILQSNGTLLSDDLLEKFAPYLTGAELTLDGPQETHDKTRVYKDGRGTYNDIVDAVQRLIKKGIHVILRINVRNAQDLYQVLSDLTEKGLRDKKEVAFYYAQTSDFGLCELFGSTKLCYEDEKRFLDVTPDLRQVIESSGWMEHLEMPEVIQKQKFVACNSEKKARYVIDPFGDIYLCFFRAGQKEYRAGVLKEGKGQFGPLYYSMVARNPLTFEECQSCPYLPLCGGGCAMRTYQQRGTFDTNCCGSVKEFAAQRILMYLRKKYPDRFQE